MNDSFRLALEKHQQGFPDQAAQLYLKVLSREPEHADALHLLGVVAHQQGRHAQAIGVIRQAPALKPGVAMYHANLAEAYRTLAEYELAAASAKTALRLRPDFAEPANMLGLLLEQPPIGLENRCWCCALRCDRQKRRTIVLRASVGSTEASNGRLARVGRIDRSIVLRGVLRSRTVRCKSVPEAGS
jgi:tetratricopeptide (TPR) repeat protein